VKQLCETRLLLEPLRLGSGKWLFGKLWEIQANDRVGVDRITVGLIGGFMLLWIMSSMGR
jgi:hypothetical protein